MFALYARAIGLNGYHLSDMDEIATISHQYYDNHLRGGEGHMEVGKLIQHVEQRKTHMVISVKPFGCMPSSGVSDGVQSLVTSKHPDAIFCAIETTGDCAVNVQSRVLMDLFKARQKAQKGIRRLASRRWTAARRRRPTRPGEDSTARSSIRSTSSPARRRPTILQARPDVKPSIRRIAAAPVKQAVKSIGSSKVAFKDGVIKLVIPLKPGAAGAHPFSRQIRSGGESAIGKCSGRSATTSAERR
jgi:hypothetical protein